MPAASSEAKVKGGREGKFSRRLFSPLGGEDVYREKGDFMMCV